MHRYPAMPGAQDRDTSRSAVAHAALNAGTLRAKALNVIERSAGLTADQVATRMGQSILAVRTRVTELPRMGKVKDTGERRKNLSGRPAIVWSAIPQPKE